MEMSLSHLRVERPMSTIIRFGLDLAKNTFSICGVDAHGKVVLRKMVPRSQLLVFFSQQVPAVVAMEAGSGAHHWARLLRQMGHDARILDPRLVAPYRRQGRSGKNDRNDAEAICEAAGRPNMHFVPVKSVEQQAQLLIHRVRASLVKEHTRLINQLRGSLAEFGIVSGKGVNHFKQEWAEIRRRHHEAVPGMAWALLDPLYAEVARVHQKLLELERQIKAFVRKDEHAARLMQVSGIGAITASAIVCTIGNGRTFRNGRQFAAWLGLTPRQSSTGGVSRLGHITKRGDTYLRTLLVHGARSDLTRTPKRTDQKSRWAEALKQKKGWNQAAVALANKHARIAWALLAKEQSYQPA